MNQPEPLRVQRATAADAAAIAAVKVVGWRTAYAGYVPPDVLAPFVDEARVAAQLAVTLADDHNLATVARRGPSDAAVGFALCVADSHLESLHVLPDQRGGGVGTELLRALAEELVRRGASILTVAVVEQNVRARGLYERLGARRTGERPAPWAPRHVRETLLRWDELAPLRAPASVNTY